MLERRSPAGARLALRAANGDLQVDIVVTAQSAAHRRCRRRCPAPNSRKSGIDDRTDEKMAKPDPGDAQQDDDRDDGEATESHPSDGPFGGSGPVRAGRRGRSSHRAQRAAARHGVIRVGGGQSPESAAQPGGCSGGVIQEMSGDGELPGRARARRRQVGAVAVDAGHQAPGRRPGRSRRVTGIVPPEPPHGPAPFTTATNPTFALTQTTALAFCGGKFAAPGGVSPPVRSG